MILKLQTSLLGLDVPFEIQTHTLSQQLVAIGIKVELVFKKQLGAWRRNA
jgi:hypothetical protein